MLVGERLVTETPCRRQLDAVLARDILDLLQVPQRLSIIDTREEIALDDLGDIHQQPMKLGRIDLMGDALIDHAARELAAGRGTLDIGVVRVPEIECLRSNGRPGPKMVEESADVLALDAGAAQPSLGCT